MNENWIIKIKKNNKLNQNIKSNNLISKISHKKLDLYINLFYNNYKSILLKWFISDLQNEIVNK